jgi:signal transduction histidine kinase
VERDGQLLGALAVRLAPTARWRTQDGQLLEELAAAAALVLENEQLIADLRASRERLVEAQDAERRRLERDLHDGAQQRLLALVIDVRRRRAQLDALDHDEVAGVLDRTADELQAAVDELRDLARGIHPALLTTSGLEAALQSIADRAPLAVTVHAPVGRMPATVESTAYFVACEALANAVRHGGASHVVITASRDHDRLVLEVGDDGDGGASPGSGSGLTGLADRVAAVGGSFSVDSLPGAGTKVRAELPCASS